MTLRACLAQRLLLAGLALGAIAPTMAAQSSASSDAEKPAALPSLVTITLKGSRFRLLDEVQTTHRQEWEFDDTVTRFRSFEGEGRLPFFDRRIAIGGEYLEYRTTVKRAGAGSSETYTERLKGGFVKGKYFLTASQTFTPYVGAGFGYVEMPDDGPSGPIETGSDTMALQGFVGLQWRTRHVGLRAEVMYLDAPDLKDHSSEKLNMSGIAATLGVCFFFGR